MWPWKLYIIQFWWCYCYDWSFRGFLLDRSCHRHPALFWLALSADSVWLTPMVPIGKLATGFCTNLRSMNSCISAKCGQGVRWHAMWPSQSQYEVGPKVKNEVSECMMSVNPTSCCALLVKHMLSPKFVACSSLVNARNFDAVSQTRYMVSQFSTHQMTVVQVACECRGEQIVEQHMFSHQCASKWSTLQSQGCARTQRASSA